MLVSTLMLILSTAIGASASAAPADAGISTMYHFDAMSRGIEPLDKSTFVQSYAEYYQLRQQMRAHASAVATIDDVPGPYRHLEESKAQMDFTEECVSALMSSPNTDDRLISQVEFAEFLNGLTDDESKDLMFHNLYWTVSLAWVVFLLGPHARTVLLRAVVSTFICCFIGSHCNSSRRNQHIYRPKSSSFGASALPVIRRMIPARLTNVSMTWRPAATIGPMESLDSS